MNEPIDQVLTEFYRGEVPTPWPAAPVVDELRSTVIDQRARRRDRLSLAVALCCLAALGIALAGRMPAPPNGIGPALEKGTATRPK